MLHRQLPPRYDAVWIGLQFADRSRHERALIDRRVDRWREGLLEKSSSAGHGAARNATAMRAIGYKEFWACWTDYGQEALELVKLRSPLPCKRQLTWLQRNPAIHWIYWKKTVILPVPSRFRQKF